MPFISGNVFSSTRRKKKTVTALKKGSKKRAATLTPVEKKERAVNKVNGPAFVMWMFKNRHRLNEEIIQPILHARERFATQGHAKKGEKTTKNPHGSRTPHSKVKLPSEIHESDFTPNVIHCQTDFKMPVEVKFKRTVGRNSRMMREAKKANPRKTTNLINDEDKTTIASLLKKVYSVCGLNRAGVFYPWAYMENLYRLSTLTTRGDLRASDQFGLCSAPAYDTFIKKNRNIGNQSELNTPFRIPEGDQDLLFPITGAKKVYEVMNANTELPVYISIYICTPRSDLQSSGEPLEAWMNLGNNGRRPTTPPIPADRRDYAINKQDFLYSYPFYLDQDPVDPTASNDKYNVSCGTEVLRDATPYFSKTFKEKWEVLDVKNVRLLPQQHCKFELEQIMHQMTSLKRVLPSAYGTDMSSDFFKNYPYHVTGRPVFMEGITLVPIFKFWGEDVVAANTQSELSKMMDAQVVSGPACLRIKIVKDEMYSQAHSSVLRATNTEESPFLNWDEAGWLSTGRNLQNILQVESAPYYEVNNFGALFTNPHENDPQQYDGSTFVLQPLPAPSFTKWSVETVSSTETRKLAPMSSVEQP